MSVLQRRLRSRLFAAPCVLACGLVVGTASLSATTGCTTHECDTSCIWIGAPAPDGSTCASGTAPSASLHHRSGGELVWESSPMEGTWLDFPGAVSYTFILPAEMTTALQNGWTLLAPTVWISTAANQIDGGGTAAPAAGQLAEVNGMSVYGFVVTNGACAEYSIRVEVHVIPPDSIASDASTE